jgi:hypothetical protein
MTTIRLAIALASLALMSATAYAQVGFRIGGGGIGLGIVTAPLIGRDRSDSAERYRAPQRTERARRKRNNDDDDDVKAAKKQEAPASQESNVAKGQNENSSISSGAAEKPANAASTATADLGNPGTPESNENSTITSSASSAVDPVKPPVTTAETDGSGNTAATCKRYFPTVGQTITVPCN